MSDDGINGGRSPAMEALAACIDEAAEIAPPAFDEFAEQIRKGGWRHGELIFISGGRMLGKSHMIETLRGEQNLPRIGQGFCESDTTRYRSALRKMLEMANESRLKVREFAAALQQANVPVPEEIDSPPKKPIRHGPQAVRKGKVKRW